MARSHCNVVLAYSELGVTYTDFAQVTGITPPEATVKDVDATHLGSTSCAEEFLPGFINAGQLEAEVNYTHTQVNTIDDFFWGRTPIYLKITIPDDSGTNDSTLIMQGYINKWRVHDQLTPGKTTSMRATFGFKVTGKPTYTPAA